MIGEKISPILEEIDNACWDFKIAQPNTKPDFTTNGFRAAISIFMFAMMDKSFENMEIKGLTQEEAIIESFKLGQELRQMVLQYTGIDTPDLYSDKQTTF